MQYPVQPLPGEFMKRWEIVQRLSSIHREMEKKRSQAREYREKFRSTIDQLDRLSAQMDSLELQLRDSDFIRFCNTPCSRF